MWIPMTEGARLVPCGYQVLWRAALTGEVRSRRQGTRWLVWKPDVLKMRRLRRELRETAGAGAR